MPSLLRIAAPKRSASGSEASTISAPVSSAFLIASSRAAGSSGLGETTVGKSPLTTSCSGTLMIFVKPILRKASGISFTPVPWIGV